MKNNKSTLILLGITLVLFIIVKIIPNFKSDIVHTTGKIDVNKKKNTSEFTTKGKAWVISSSGDTLTPINLEIAKSEYEIERGLMHRKSLGENNGVLFVFKEESPLKFWMKNTSIPLDIIYLRYDGSIVSITPHTIPFSLELIHSKGSAYYALEVNEGFVDRNRIMLNSKLIFDKNY